jgi:hypothetical protein
MPALPTKHYAAELQRQLRALLGHGQIVAQAYGAHMQIKRPDDQDPIVMARLTELGRNLYGQPFAAIAGDGNLYLAQGRSMRWLNWSLRT